MQSHPIITSYPLADMVTAFSTTRHGGVGKGCYADFNINPYCGDAPKAVQANRAALAQVLQVIDSHIVLPHQVHGDRCLAVTEDLLRRSSTERQVALEGYDALMTQLHGVCIGVSTADCIPVLLYDPNRQAAAAIHAGWRGTVQRIVGKTLQEMVDSYGTHVEDVRAVIGPGISLANFEVGQEVYDRFAEAHFDMDRIAKRYAKWHLDLPLCNQLQLQEAGVQRDNILASGICTFDRVDDYFSARRLGTASGRIYTGIILR